MNNALQITGLSKSFPGFSIKDISLELPEGYIMGFIGPNGAGKTTVIKIILNMMKKDSGKIKVFGLDHIGNEEEIKENLGVVLEQPYLLDQWTIKELENTVKPFYKTWNMLKYRQYLKEFSLHEDLRIRNLSKGMKLKLMIAVALSHDARLLILDEPTSGLDAVSRDELLDILRNYIVDGDKSILLSSHITSDLEKAADYITFIYRGEMVYTGTKDGLLESYCMVKGDRKDITPEQRAGIIGYSEYPNGFEGLLPVGEVKDLSRNIVTDTVTLDDIILFTDRGRRGVY
jgi:ABC-2 type transport system ATP-binding protein